MPTGYFKTFDVCGRDKMGDMLPQERTWMATLQSWCVAEVSNTSCTHEDATYWQSIARKRCAKASLNPVHFSCERVRGAATCQNPD